MKSNPWVTTSTLNEGATRKSDAGITATMASYPRATEKKAEKGAYGGASKGALQPKQAQNNRLARQEEKASFPKTDWYPRLLEDLRKLVKTGNESVAKCTVNLTVIQVKHQIGARVLRDRGRLSMDRRPLS
jgi:hypothetical protein